MTKTIYDCPRFNDYLNIIDNMYRLGWDERNGGNVSLLLDSKDVDTYLEGGKKVIRDIPLPLTADPILKGRVFIFTGTGRYFRNTKADPSHNVGIIRISDDLKVAHVLWGFEGGGCFTSEIFAHLMCHATRLKVNPSNHVVMHCHPAHIVSLSSVLPVDEKEYTLALWRVETECIVVFPEGVAVLPWMLCGTDEIGKATSEKMKDRRLVVWTLHGIYASGNDIDETFGLIETAEKAAQMYFLAHSLGAKNIITDEQLKMTAKRFNVTPREGYLK
jgi:rhamnulose-1-phosphate aldolase